MKCPACETPYVNGEPICMCSTAIGQLNPQESKVRAVLFAQNFALVQMIERELSLGTKHYSKTGKLLPDLQSVMNALRKDEFGKAEPTKAREKEFFEERDIEPGEEYEIKNREEGDGN